MCRRYVGPHHDKYWFKGTPVIPGLRTTYPAFGQPAAKPVLFGVDEGDIICSILMSSRSKCLSDTARLSSDSGACLLLVHQGAAQFIESMLLQEINSTVADVQSRLVCRVRWSRVLGANPDI